MTKRTLIIINLFLILTFSNIGQAQTSTFTFQGKLDDNSIAAQGTYQMKFSLFDAAAGGTQIGATIENTTVNVVNGVFTVQLDFGGMAFDGTDRFIEVEVCKSACPTYTTLNPRQQVTSSPYAIKSQNAANATTADTAATATNATQLGGVAASQFIQEGDARLTDDRPPTAGSGNYIQNTTTEQAASNFHISGTGTANIFDADTEYRIGGNRILSTGSVNLFVGIGAGANGNSGTDFGNSFFGQNAGATNMDGTRNSFFGADAGKNTTGNNNIALGYEAGNALTTGDNNIAIGNPGVAAESDTIRIGNTQTNTFIAGVINGDGSGLTNVNAATATTATNFSGSLSGDVTGTQSATVVSTVGSVSAANVASGANAANAATDTNTAGTIVKRDGSGNFSAGTINADGLSLPATSSSSVGLITQNGDRLMHTFGTDNFFAGINAGNFTMTGNFNTATGRSALSSNSTGSQNTATGAFALNNNTTGTGNTASGQGALSSNTTGSQNTASGAQVLQNNSTGSSNTATGRSTLFSNTTGSQNTATGAFALNNNTTGFDNTASGSFALFFNTTGSGNTASGHNALFGNTEGFNNTASGRNALQSNTTGFNNTAGGRSALNSNTTGFHNTASGSGALQSNTLGNYNTAVGTGSLDTNTIGNNNIAIGKDAGNALTTGDNNIAIGNAGVAAESDTIRIGNTQTNTFIAGVINGDGSGLTNVNAATATTATNFSGSLSGDVTGTQSATVVSTVGSVSAANVASGANAANAATDTNTAGTIVKRDGSGNFSAGTINANGLSLPPTNASGSVGVITQNGGRLIHTFGTNNIFAGADAGNFTMTGVNNTASGINSLFNNMTGSQNVASGSFTLFSNTMGFSNTAFGFNALKNNTTGDNNIAIGKDAGFNLTTGDNNIAIGNAGVAAESDTIRIGNAQTSTFIAGINGATSSGGSTVFVNGSGQLGTILSSRRFKDNIFDMDKTSEVIFALRPVRFIYKPELDKNSIPQWGLIAEEVNEVSPDLVIRNAEGEIQTVRYEQINAMMLNEVIKQHRRVENLISEKEAVQERLTELEDQNKQLQEENEKIQTQVKKQQTVIDALLIMICADKPDAAICKEARK